MHSALLWRPGRAQTLRPSWSCAHAHIGGTAAVPSGGPASLPSLKEERKRAERRKTEKDAPLCVAYVRECVSVCVSTRCLSPEYSGTRVLLRIPSFVIIRVLIAGPRCTRFVRRCDVYYDNNVEYGRKYRHFVLAIPVLRYHPMKLPNLYTSSIRSF